MCYFGLIFASTGFSGDAFTNFSLGAFIEIPGDIFCLLAMDCWGRRPILCFCQTVGGIACILTGLLQDIPAVAHLQVGKNPPDGATLLFIIVLQILATRWRHYYCLLSIVIPPLRRCSSPWLAVSAAPPPWPSSTSTRRNCSRPASGTR